MKIQGYSFTSPWFFWVVGLFIFTGACWLPVVKIQYKLRELAKVSVNTNEVTHEFTSLMRTWMLLGIPAFVTILGIFWLMVFKPFPLA